MTAPHIPDPSATRDADAPARAFTSGFVALLACALAALLVLLALGTWQVRRLAWKEELLATIEMRRAAEPRPLDDVIAAAAEEGGPGGGRGRLDYRPAIASGRFEPGEARVYATDQGVVGWQVLSPLRLPDGRALIVNRGFVPDQLLGDAPRRAPPKGEVTVAGLLRDPLFDKPNRFVPDNAADEFYWKDFAALSAALALGEAETVPAILDAGATPTGQLPVGGQTVIDLPNNHLGYAVTWYGIAVGLLGVVAVLVRGRVRRARGAARDRRRP